MEVVLDSFSDRLSQKILEKRTPVLVGLDPRWALLPQIFTQNRNEAKPEDVAAAFEAFCRSIIDIVSPWVPAVKPQAAFFEQYGPCGMVCLANVIRYAREKGLLVLLDGKRNDIGSTASAYAAGFLGGDGSSVWGADALTVSPYLGGDSLTPFVDVANERNAGVFILVKTSNPGGAMFQDLIADGIPVYRHVASYVEALSRESQIKTVIRGAYGNIGAVVGATWPSQLAELRSVMPHVWFLVPGYGSQGGTAADVGGAFDEKGLGAVVNNSRGILFAHRSSKYADSFGENHWEKAVEAATLEMIHALAAETNAGKL